MIGCMSCICGRWPSGNCFLIDIWFCFVSCVDFLRNRRGMLRFPVTLKLGVCLVFCWGRLLPSTCRYACELSFQASTYNRNSALAGHTCLTTSMVDTKCTAAQKSSLSLSLSRSIYMYTRWLLVCSSAVCELWSRYGYPARTKVYKQQLMPRLLYKTATQNTKQNHMPIKKKGGRRPPSTNTRQAPNHLASKKSRAEPPDATRATDIEHKAKPYAY